MNPWDNGYALKNSLYFMKDIEHVKRSIII